MGLMGTTRYVNSSEERSPERIPHRLLLDNLSDEEEQIPDDVMRQKTHFFPRPPSFDINRPETNCQSNRSGLSFIVFVFIFWFAFRQTFKVTFGFKKPKEKE